MENGLIGNGASATNILENLVALTQVVFFVAYSILGFMYIAGIFLVWRYHRQRERIINELEVKSKGEFAGQPKSFAEGRVGEFKEAARPQLEKLERKQRFILDILPFIRKY